MGPSHWPVVPNPAKPIDLAVRTLPNSCRSTRLKKAVPVPVRAWESQGAGNTFDLEGPDAQAVTMPPAPMADSPELIAEMAEVYEMALLRDVPFCQV
jgi:hypothetical protein